MELTDFAAANNLVGLFLDRADEFGDRPFLWAKRDSHWQSLSWNEVARQVCLLAENLRGLGLNAGDRVVLVSENRPEWCIADLAIMAAGCITVPAYITNTERDHQHILDNSGARAVIVSTEKLAKPLMPAIMRSGLAGHVIGMDDLRRHQSGAFDYHSWAEMVAGDAAAARAAVDDANRRDRASGHCLHHLHQRHRRRAARRDAASRRDPVQCRRRGRIAGRGFRLGRGNLPLLPPAVPRL